MDVQENRPGSNVLIWHTKCTCANRWRQNISPSIILAYKTSEERRRQKKVNFTVN